MTILNPPLDSAGDADLALWRASLRCLCEILPAEPASISTPHRESLGNLAASLPQNADLNSLELCRQQTAAILASYGAQLSAYLDTHDKEAKAVLQSVAQMTDTLAALERRHTATLDALLKKLRALASTEGQTMPRRALEAETQSLALSLEQAIELQQRELLQARSRLSEEISRSEARKRLALPSPAAQHGSSHLRTLKDAVRSWPHYCLVRYEFSAPSGSAFDAAAWLDFEAALAAVLPGLIGHPVTPVSPQPGAVLAAVACYLLEYAAKAEEIEASLSQLSGALCRSRVVEPRRGPSLHDESMREALARLEQAR